MNLEKRWYSQHEEHFTTPIITDNRYQRGARLGFSTRRRAYFWTPPGGMQLDCRRAKPWVLCSI